MIEVHHLNNSRSQRILWLLEELGLEYGVVRYERDPRTMLAPDSLKAVHPLGKAPAVRDGDLLLTESGAIAETLLERHDPDHRLSPRPGAPDRARHLHWLHFAEGTAMGPLVLSLYLGRLGEAAGPLRERVAAQAAAQFDQAEQALAEAPHFGGAAFSTADVLMSYPVEAGAARLGLGGRPRLADWLGRMRARPAHARALERGGPFEILR